MFPGILGDIVMAQDIQKIADKIASERSRVAMLREEMGRVLVGQHALVDRLLIGLLCDGHVLVEGLPGLAKTTAVRALGNSLQMSFSRIQFTPDLLPADIVGTMIYKPSDGTFAVKKGPVFANIVLADEINRAPAKVQSALLEAMQEHQVTLGSQTFVLDDPFLVMATQNPIEQQGTYPLPEAQVDRFMLKIKVGYPQYDEELEILNRNVSLERVEARPVLAPEDVKRMRSLVADVYMDEKIKRYILNLVMATRTPAEYKIPKLKSLIFCGASPRASIALAKAAKAHAFLEGRGFVTPQDVKAMALDVLRHRVMVSYEAEAEELTSDDIVKDILNHVDVP
jgi:MoxR-like ATPase